MGERKDYNIRLESYNYSTVVYGCITWSLKLKEEQRLWITGEEAGRNNRGLEKNE
jgi:hypothetical protein